MQKTIKYIKSHCTDHIKIDYVHMLVIIKEILAKNVFSYVPELLAAFYTTYTQHTDFPFGPNLVHSKFADNKCKILSFTLYPQGAQNKSFEL